jgi:hypothetical protein
MSLILQENILHAAISLDDPTYFLEWIKQDYPISINLFYYAINKQNRYVTNYFINNLLNITITVPIQPDDFLKNINYKNIHILKFCIFYNLYDFTTKLEPELFFDAIKSNDTDAINTYIRYKIFDINILDHNQKSVLYYTNYNTNTVRFLLQNGADPNLGFNPNILSYDNYRISKNQEIINILRLYIKYGLVLSDEYMKTWSRTSSFFVLKDIIDQMR